MKTRARFSIKHKDGTTGGVVLDGSTPVLNYWFLEAFARLHNTRELNIEVIGTGETIYCDFGGVVRDVVYYLNHGEYRSGRDYIFDKKLTESLDAIRNRT